MISEKQRQQRRKHIGSSDVAALFGLCPFKNEADVYWDKIGLERDRTNAAAMVGNWLEGPIIDRCEAELDIKIDLRDITCTSTEHEVMSANLDAITEDNEPVEIKTVRWNAPDRDQWGDPYTDQVPDRVMLQVQHQMYCCEGQRAYVVAMDQDYNLTVYVIPRNETIIETIIARAMEFWAKHVEGGEAPDVTPSAHTLRAIPREPDSIANVDESLVVAFDNARADMREAKAKYDEAQRELMAAMGTAEYAKGMNFEVTFKKRNRSEYTVKAGEFRTLNARMIEQ